MKILSFDVGIKNLAYCLIDKNKEDFKIEDWGIINLDDDRKTCTFINNRKKKCGTTATHSYIHNQEQGYYCKKHKKTYEMPEIKIICCENTEKCGYKNKKGIICNKKGSNKIEKEKTILCNAHLKSEKNSRLKEIGPIKLKNQNCNKIGVQILATKLFKYLDNKKNFLNVDEVLIENQPSLLNPTMKTRSSFVYSYFCMRGIVDGEKTKSIIESVKFFSPSNKLKVNKDQSNKMLKKGETEREIYIITKDLGEAYCKALIKDDEVNINYINNQVKKDDLCDAFLQGFYHLYYKDVTCLPEKYKIILEKVAKEIDEIEKLKQNKKTENILKKNNKIKNIKNKEIKEKI